MNLINKLLENDFTKWFAICVFKKYADFNGRARRKEYWMFALVSILVCVTCGILAAIFSSIANFLGLIFVLLYVVFGCAVILPAIAAVTRRLHDVGKSGWFQLIQLVPLVGPIYLLYLMVKDGDPGPNQYGPNPKGL
jgi:uncharacterized membrane protein YhaH (DUF805 family)